MTEMTETVLAPKLRSKALGPHEMRERRLEIHAVRAQLSAPEQPQMEPQPLPLDGKESVIPRPASRKHCDGPDRM